jgi:predicted NBD/HSP70 family sugar kinase
MKVQRTKKPLETISSLPSAGNRTMLRQINNLAVLRELQKGEKTSKSLVEELELSRTAVESVLEDLLKLNWIVARSVTSGQGDLNSVGRPSKLFQINSKGGHFASIDIGAHHIFVLISDLQGNICSSMNERVPESLTSEKRLAQAFDLLNAALLKAGISLLDIWIATVGTPGVVENGVVIFYGGKGMPNWSGTDLKQHFTKKLKCEVLVEGNCNLGTLAEKWKGAAESAMDFVYVFSGTRTGAGIFLDGSLRRGHRGGTGLIGHLPEIGWSDIEESLYVTPGKKRKFPGHDDMFFDSKLGISKATKAVAEYSKLLARGVAAICLTLDPELIVIGGPNSEYGDMYLESFRKELEAIYPLRSPKVVISSLGIEGPCLGGIKLAMDSMNKKLNDLLLNGRGLIPCDATSWKNNFLLQKK